MKTAYAAAYFVCFVFASRIPAHPDKIEKIGDRSSLYDGIRLRGSGRPPKVLAEYARPQRKIEQEERTKTNFQPPEKINNYDIETRFFVEYDNEKGKADATEALSNEVLAEFKSENLMVVRLNNSFLSLLEKNDHIVKIEEDYPIFGFSSSKDDGTANLLSTYGRHYRTLKEVVPYGIRMIQADQLTMGPHDVTVCLVDSGIMLEHPDLDAGFISGHDSNAAEGGNTLYWNEDIFGHGTHVAGTISAIMGNNQGIRGVGRIKLHITRGLDSSGYGYESYILTCIEQCIEANATIINLSVGTYEMSQWMRSSYARASQKHGILLIAASGNSGTDYLYYPASHPDVISVGAVDETGTLADFSNFGEQVELVAPGLLILSTSSSNTAVVTQEFSYTAYQISSIAQNARGGLMFCSDNDRSNARGDNNSNKQPECDAYDGIGEGAICLIAVTRQTTFLGPIIQACTESKGIGAIIFSAEHARTGDRYYFESSTIPLLGVSHAVGLDLALSMMSSSTATIVDLKFTYHQEHAGSNDLPPEYTYSYFSGTSMAAPHVAAAAALVWSHFPDCTNQQMRYALARTAIDRGEKGCDDRYGYGIVNAKAAYDYLLVHMCNSTSQDGKGKVSSWGVNSSTGGCSII